MTTKTRTLSNMFSASSISLLIGLLMTLLGSLIFSANANADNRYHRHQAAHQIKHKNYQYIYYPAHQIYYAPHTRQWYWNSGNRWQSAHYAPAYFNVNLRIGGIPIHLQTALPYQEHAYVTRQYHYAWNQHRKPHPHYVKEKYNRNRDSHRRHDRQNRHDD